MTDREKVIEIHNVVCPRCGLKPEIEWHNARKYTVSGCEHKEILELIQQRTDNLLPTTGPNGSARPLTKSEQAERKMTITYGEEKE